MKHAFTLVFYLFGFIGFSAAQQTGQIANSSYQANIPLNQETISGGYYVDPPPSIEGDPYFSSRKSFELGTLTVNGITYQDVHLLYNIYTDEIITFHPEHKQRVLIKTEKINGFSLLEKSKSNFVKITENPGYALHGNGFYELVSSGNADFLCKHYKTRKEKQEISLHTSEFVEKIDYWLQKDGALRLVKKKGDIAEFLAMDKKVVRQLGKERNMLFKADKRAYILMVVSHYNGMEL